MRTLLGLTVILTSLSCMTKALSQKSSQAQSQDVLLSRTIGADSQSHANSYFQECQIREHQVSSKDDISQVIKDLESEKMQIGYPFTAFVPSSEYYYYRNGSKHLIARYSSKIETKPSSAKLIATIDSICGKYDARAAARAKSPQEKKDK